MAISGEGAENRAWLIKYLAGRGMSVQSSNFPFVDNIGLLDSYVPATMSFLGGKKYFPQLKTNNNISAVLTTAELSGLVPESVCAIVCDNPAYEFACVFNAFHERLRKQVPTTVHPSAKIHESAVISPFNVNISENVIIGARAVILEDVTVGKNSEIREGTVVGCSNTEMKMTTYGVVDMYHNKGVVIGDNVIVGSNCTIDKGIYDRHTVIGEWARVGGNTLIGHGAQLGEKCCVFCCTICGSATVGEGARINPGAVVSNKVIIEAGATVSVGAVVVSNVKKDSWVSGNFAINHKRFLQRYTRAMGRLDSEE